MSNLVAKVNAMSDETTNPEQSPVESNPSDRDFRVDLLIVCALLVLTISFWNQRRLLGLRSFAGSGEATVRQMAVGRCAVFIAIMAGVHFIGFRLWQRAIRASQWAVADAALESTCSASISSAYWPPMKTALLQQGIIFFLALLMLDGGPTFKSR